MSELVAHYGYFAVFGLIAVQCLGIPLPGEAALIAAAIYAEHTHRLEIFWVVVAAAVASGLGSIGGYLIGRHTGHPLLVRHGHKVGLNAARIRLGEYLFSIHGGKILLFGRVVAVLRTYGAMLAGVYSMPPARFLVFNGIGAVIWGGGIGYAAYGFGELFTHVAGVLAWIVLFAGAGLIIASVLYLKRKEGALQAQADAAMLAPKSGD
jgi:membrane protein DedA with SNARE-associated domain